VQEFEMPRGPKGERRPADVIGNAVHVIRTHKAHRVTPAMAAGLADKLMDMTEVARLMDDAEMKVTVQNGWPLTLCHNQTETRPAFWRC
jgi:hypothetical protein